LTAASKVLLECQRCSYAPGVTQFPPDSIPLFTWTIVGGVFTEAGHSDFRALFSTKRIVGGSGILMLENGGAATVSVDPTLVPMHILSTPKMSHENCTTGEFSFDNDYYYVCVAANTWKRLPLSSF
jgi:hypothetical protein